MPVRMFELLIIVPVLVVCTPLVVQLFRCLNRAVATVASIAVVGGAVAFPALFFWRAAGAGSESVDPRDVSYETALSCKKCHADHYESWHRSYHRTMTQEAALETIRGDFNDVTFNLKGFEGRAFRQGDRFLMDLIDRRWEQAMLARGRNVSAADDPPRALYSVDRLVGSHNRQVCLTKLADGTYMTLPVLWQPAEQRWVSESGAILMPRSRELFANSRVWNRSCVRCHNTNATPGLVTDQAALQLGRAWATRVSELGISCEACHGPGERHVAANRDPLRRYVLDKVDGGDPTIVDPKKLTKQRSVELCGRCHGSWVVKPELQNTWLVNGQLYRPGQALEQDHLHSPRPGAIEDYTVDYSGHFWPDWTPRPTAHDFEGVILSPCYQRGEMTCLSCHSMHHSNPDDQLIYPENPDTMTWESNQACLQCHQQYEGDALLAEHTHHATDSPGSRCYNCHMPFQQYGLGKPIRTHRVSQPNAAASNRFRVPNACNQCHVDQTLQWTGQWLAEWFGHEVPDLAEDSKRISATVLQLLQGDAFARTIATTRLGWKDAEEAAPGDWRVALLTYAMQDNYEVVRVLAYEALRKQPGYGDVAFDYLADSSVRNRQVQAVRRRWLESKGGSTLDLHPALPLERDGRPKAAVIDRLIQGQDRSDVYLSE